MEIRNPRNQGRQVIITFRGKSYDVPDRDWGWVGIDQDGKVYLYDDPWTRPNMTLNSILRRFYICRVEPRESQEIYELEVHDNERSTRRPSAASAILPTARAR
jgi:hypothetical protein